MSGPARTGTAREAVVALTLGLSLGGCTGGAADPGDEAGSGGGATSSGDGATAAPGDGATADDGAAVLQPGLPGEPNESMDPDATGEPVPYNDADVGFLNEMIPHHAQALEMAELARSRAEDRDVRALAARIGDAQSAEIAGMPAWLQRHELDVPDAEDVEHHLSMAGMPGMLDPAEMDALAAADGADFDRLYLAGMIEHHRGALLMARDAQTAGSDVLVGEIADEVSAGQTAEIQRMQVLQRRL